MLLINIRQLLQIRESKLEKALAGKNLAELPILESAWLKIKKDRIHSFGLMADLKTVDDEEIIDVKNRIVMPSFVDSHTHLVFAGSREEEFVMRLHGKSYEEIAEAGGGILNSAKKLQSKTEEELFETAKKRLHEVISMGTGAIEIKSGYGLTVEAEIKMLRVIQKLKAYSPIPIKASFLGAHFYPKEYKQNHEGYISLIIDEMLPIISKENLADYIDAFCEKVAFSAEETDRIIKAGIKHGLKAKIHTNQFNCMGGIEVSVANNAISVDHLEVINQDEIDCLKNSNTIATLLPSAPFFLNDPYQPAREIIDAGIPVALASDYNPGSTPSGRMSFVLSLACIKLKMTPEEAINAATINGAFALEMQDEMGSITVGKKANLIISKEIDSYGFIPYSFGSDQIEEIIINGKRM
ncbi:MAG: imidazolonepropionase [Bacteroidetes bacterium]|nr:MAG: imidazolonepropionase [Bacteroidota bacterium]MBL1144111.1 imidazolonepropionase [Bacteroidota bacterium]NOG56906.1 imidazolonepropionase [Bacteroidota bacterium]